MNFEIATSAGVPDRRVLDPTAIDNDVYNFTEQGMVVADAIADRVPFNSDCAEMSMRCLAGMFNGVGGFDEKTLLQLPEAVHEELIELARRSYEFMYTDGGKQEIGEHLSFFRPQSDEEAQTAVLGHAFNLLQLKTSIGPDREGGYPESKLNELRPLVRDFGHAFAVTYRVLNGQGHPLATDLRARGYFEGNIKAATPHELRPGYDEEVYSGPDIDGPSDWI
jgi:hypothetical protein